MALVLNPAGPPGAAGAAGATGAAGIFDYHAAGIVTGTANGANSITWGIQFRWNGQGTAPQITGARVLIHANATNKVYEVRLLRYTAATTTVEVEKVNVTTTTAGQGNYTVAFTPLSLSAYLIYGIAITGAGEAYYTTATFAYTTASGPGHLVAIATLAPPIAVGASGAEVTTVNHVLVNYGGSPPGVPQTAVTITGFHPIHPTFSNAS